MQLRLSILPLLLLVSLLAACGGGGSGTDSGSGSDGDSIDLVSPYVSSTNPVHNSNDVATNRAITATFNEAVDPAMITSNTFLVDDANDSPVTGSVTYDEGSRTALFRSSVVLAPGAAYTATITADVEDLAGNTLVKDYTWQFT
ncbi:MAG: Ig-like domain-containing protein, partial [Desulfuromonadales bacterium]